MLVEISQLFRRALLFIALLIATSFGIGRAAYFVCRKF